MSMDNNKLYTLNREGTSQLERFPEALSGDYVKIDERSIADLVRQSAEYANYVRYYNNSNKEEGRWRAFFEEIYDYKEKRARFSSLEELERKASTSPHLTLFLAFLRLFGIAQDHLNTLTEAHLDFYYKEILQLKPRPEIPDSVPLFFQLNKAAQQAMVPANTLFPAGSDKNGKPLFYASKNDLIVNKAKVGAVKGIYKANSQIYLINDMLSKADNRDSGLTDTFLGAICNETARYGFAMASPLLHLKDGIRDITITEFADMSSYFDVEYSSESGWEEAVFDKNMIRIVEQQPPVVAYNESIHQAGFDTDYPVIRLIYKNGKANFDLTIPKIKVSVKGTKDFLLRNDYGVVNHEQVFFPFGIRPVKDSTLRIYNKNIFNSYLKEGTVKINIKWKGKPSFSTHYQGYPEKPVDEFSDPEKLTINKWKEIRD
ncbi:hypothetical protein FACS1894177_06690 [Bacteroidia bacterium]|nr:hypothetical protein FACS1894177_06690 [Bacteroidia bacterium]